MVNRTPVENRYAFVERLGEAPSGRVWLASDRAQEGRNCAVKRFDPIDRERAENMAREFVLLSRLIHPNLIPLLDFTSDPLDSTVCFSMEAIEGSPLDAATRSEGPDLLVELVGEALRGLAFLHDFGRAHGNLKPSNLRIRNSPSLGSRLVLFDAAPALRGEACREKPRAEDLPWTAPELFDGDVETPSSDLYSLGTVVFAAIHGHAPFVLRGRDRAGFMETVRQGRRTRPALPDGFPSGLADWLEELLASDPDARPANASDARDSLAQAIGTTLPAESAAGRAGRLVSETPAGRADAMRALWDNLAPSSRAKVIWLSGPRGSGKGRLLHWLRADAVSLGWEVDEATEVVRGGELDGARRIATLENLRATANQKPTLLLIDRTESASTALIEYLERVAREKDGPPLRVVAAVDPTSRRHPLLEKLIADSAWLPTLARVDLSPLGGTSIREAAKRLGMDDAVVARRIRRQSNGVSQRVEELLLATANAADAEGTDDSANLSEATGDWLEALGVLGGTAEADLVESVAGIDREAGTLAGHQTTTLGLVRRLDVGFVLVRTETAIPIAIEKGTRRFDLAVQAASLLGAGTATGTASRLRARLLRDTDRADRAIEAAIAAAESARRVGDGWDESECLSLALRTLPRRDPRHGELRALQADALARVGLFMEAARGYSGALIRGRAPGFRARTLARWADALERAGRHRAASTIAARAIAEARPLDSPVDRALAERVLGRTLIRCESVVEAVPAFQNAVDLLREANAPGDEAAALLECATAERLAGKPAAGARFRSAIDSADRLDDLDSGIAGRLGKAQTERDEGNHSTAQRWFDEALDLATRRGTPAQLATIAELRTKSSFIAGRYAETLSIAVEAEALATLAGDRRGRSAILAYRVRTLERCGQTSDAAALEATLEACPEDGDLESIAGTRIEPHFEARTRIDQAAEELAGGRFEAAVKSAALAEDLARGGDLPDLGAEAAELAVAAHEKLGQTRQATEALSRGRRLLDVAADRIGDAALRSGFLDDSRFARLRKAATRGASDMRQRLSTLYQMSRALNSESDPEALLETILDMALQVVSAERGMILLRDTATGKMNVRLARNLERQTIVDAEAFSASIVSQAGSGRAVLAIDTGADERVRDLRSVSLYGIRSVLGVPLRSRGRVIGAVYLDNRSEGSLFTADDLRFLEAFADHAALALQNATARKWLEEENQRLQVAAEHRFHFGNIVGESAPMRRMFELIEKVAKNDQPVLIQGESGTGKELVARAVHFNSPRRERSFVAENCAAIPDTLLQSELFGHVRGAFTGADRDRAGMFEQAEDGSLFLDEVGEMSPSMQAQLLRAIQEHEIRRVGGNQPIKVNVRIVAATNRDLEAEVQAGRFREDLLYRLQVLVIRLPALRERKSDIPLLVDHFIDCISRARKRERPRVDPEVMELLQNHRWPGNVRQLENVLQRLCLFADDGPIHRDLVEREPSLRKIFIVPDEDSAPLFRENSESERIRTAMRVAKGNRARAARTLGISRSTLYRKIRLLGVD